MFTAVLRQLWPALRLMVVMTVLLGLAYPLALTGFAQVASDDRADGSLIRRDGKVVGSKLIGQSFAGQPQYFQSRPSAAGDGYDGLSSSASNLGPESTDLLAGIEERRAAAAALDGTAPDQVAPDALTASGSGLDPQISPAYAEQQVARIARERGMTPAVTSSMLLNFFFTPPLHTLTIGDTNNALALVVFVLVGMLVSSAVDLAARRTRQAARAAAESRTLANLAGSVLAGSAALAEMLERVRETFGLTTVALIERDSEAVDPSRWVVRACAGPEPTNPGAAESEVSVAPGVFLALHGRLLAAEDQRLLGAFAAQVAVVLDRMRLSEEAAAAAPLAEANKMRTALLAAVGHDLRAPLAAAKAAVSSLRSPDIDLGPDDRAELLSAADVSLDRLASLVENLLDMSRLQAGALSIELEPVALDELVALAVDDLGEDSRAVNIDRFDDLPLVMVDAGLAERVLANLVSNAARYSPVDLPPRITGSRLGDQVQVRVVDRGPGIPAEDRDRVFLPFQRMGDTDNTTGIGLGLALARGLTEAMGGTLEPEETPGGGLTMVITLNAVPEHPRDPGQRERTEAER